MQTALSSIRKVLIQQGDLLFIGGRWKEVMCTYHVGDGHFAEVRGEMERFPTYQPVGAVDKFLGFNHYERRKWYASDERAVGSDPSEAPPYHGSGQPPSIENADRWAKQIADGFPVTPPSGEV